MDAYVFKSGRVEIEFNLQGEKLEAPSYVEGEKRHWLPCSGSCRQLLNVAWNVVAIICPPCQQEENE